MSAKGIDCDTYHDRVVIKMVGCPEIEILKPTTVTLDEWYGFWGNPLSGSNPYLHKQFTVQDANDNNRRRLAALEEVNGS